MIGFKALGAICALALAPIAFTSSSDFLDDANDFYEYLQDHDIYSGEDVIPDRFFPVIDGSVSDNFIDSDPVFSDSPFDVPSDRDDPLYSYDDFIMFFSNYDTYYGSIGTTYLEYMRGFLPKLSFNDHYVASRVSQYQYIFAYGSSLSWTGSLFTGSDVMVITLNTNNNGSYTSGVQSSFTLNPGSFMVYSDLSDVYPSLADSGDFSLRQIVIFIGILVTFYTVGLFIKGFSVKRRSRKW